MPMIVTEMPRVQTSTEDIFVYATMGTLETERHAQMLISVTPTFMTVITMLHVVM